jgi:hypothetical protein
VAACAERIELGCTSLTADVATNCRQASLHGLRWGLNIGCLGWLWLIDCNTPSRKDGLGAALCVAEMGVIVLSPPQSLPPAQHNARAVRLG